MRVFAQQALYTSALYKCIKQALYLTHLNSHRGKEATEIYYLFFSHTPANGLPPANVLLGQAGQEGHREHREFFDTDSFDFAPYFALKNGLRRASRTSP
ncbi:MAG: hypothetical protein MUP16_03685, partial [Sedimentisphaerales bacterium]|nr:hypothetical protein [Sedimentisphaerales bacterium]